MYELATQLNFGRSYVCPKARHWRFAAPDQELLPTWSIQTRLRDLQDESAALTSLSGLSSSLSSQHWLSSCGVQHK